MERLTEYCELGFYVDKSKVVDISQVARQFFEKGAYMGKAIDKLGELEDFLEEIGLENVKQLKEHYDNTFGYINSLITEITELKQYNKTLKKLNKENKSEKWVKLKEFVENTHVGTYAWKMNILDKMKELEQGE